MRAPIRSAASLLLALGLAACGGPVLFADLELPSVEVTLPQYQFPGTPLGVPLTKDVAFDLGANVPVVNQQNVMLDLKLNRMTLVLDTSGPLSSFDQVERVTITALHPATTTLPDLVLIDYANPHTATGVTTITATSQSGADLTPYLVAGAITLRAVYSGSGLPTSAWTADVTADFWMKVRFDYANI